MKTKTLTIVNAEKYYMYSYLGRTRVVRKDTYWDSGYKSEDEIISVAVIDECLEKLENRLNYKGDF